MARDCPPDTADERWNDIPGYEGIYFASTLGRVFSAARMSERSDGRFRRVGGRLLRGHHKTSHYHLMVDGIGKMISPQAAVLLAFVRAPENNELAVVIDEKIGAILGNVEWRKIRDFTNQKFKGLCGNRTVNAAQVRDILSRDISTTQKTDEVAAEFGMHRNSIYRLHRGETWPEVQRATETSLDKMSEDV